MTKFDAIFRFLTCPRLLLIFTALSLSGCMITTDHPVTFGDPFTAALRAEQQSRFEEASHLYREAARTGVVAAENNLGLLYRRGLGGPRDEIQAWSLFRSAALKDLSFGWFNLAQMIEAGEAGQSIDLDLAFFYYKRAFILSGNDGNTAVYGAMGLYYENGWSVPRNLTRAVEYYTTGAALGDPVSRERLDVLGLRPAPTGAQP